MNSHNFLLVAAVSAPPARWIGDLRERFGVHSYADWHEFAERCGIDVVRSPRLLLPGCLLGNMVILRSDLVGPGCALVAWHEVGHALLHAGNREFWRQSFVGGAHVLRRFERQAWLFAVQFPVWDDEALGEAISCVVQH